MYQVNFSDQAMRALGKLPTLEQMEVVEAFSSLTPEDLLAGRSASGPSAGPATRTIACGSASSASISRRRKAR